MNKSFVFTNVRILYPAILQPKTRFGGDGEEYGFVMLVKKTDKALLDRFQKTYNEMVKQEFGKKPANLRPAIGKPEQKAILKDGDVKYASVDVDSQPNYEAYRGHYYTNMSRNVLNGKIEAIDLEKQPILTNDQLPSGAYGHVVAELACYKSPKWGPQFSVRPILIQVTDISEPLGISGLSADAALKVLEEAVGVDDII